MKIREQTPVVRTAEEKEVHDQNLVNVEKAKKTIEKTVNRSVNLSIRIKEDTMNRLDQMVYKKGMEGLAVKKKPLKRNTYIELAISELLKREGM
jgi:hypothetical protein